MEKQKSISISGFGVFIVLLGIPIYFITVNSAKVALLQRWFGK